MRYAEQWALTEVNYLPEREMWSTTAYDREGNQVGESEFHHKVDAEDTAFDYLDSGRCNIVQVKSKRGLIDQYKR